MTIRIEYFGFAHLTEKQEPGNMSKVSIHEAKVGSKGCKTAAHNTRQGAGWSVPVFSRGSMGALQSCKAFK